MTDRPETERVDALAGAVIEHRDKWHVRIAQQPCSACIPECGPEILAALTAEGWTVERASLGLPKDNECRCSSDWGDQSGICRLCHHREHGTRFCRALRGGPDATD